MLRPSSWFDYIRIKRALPKYWPYSPPLPGPAKKLSRRKAQVNFDYFILSKEHRIDFLSRFLEDFSVELEFTPEGLRDVCSWTYRYGGHLFNGAPYFSPFISYDPSWTGPLAGLSIVHDLGVFAGEYIVRHNPTAKWILSTGSGYVSDREMASYYRPVISDWNRYTYQGQHLSDAPFNILDYVFEGCCSMADRVQWDTRRVGDPRYEPGNFFETILSIANPKPNPFL